MQEAPPTAAVWHQCSDVLALVFQFLPTTRAVLNCSLVCRTWHHVVTSNTTLLPSVSLRICSNAHTAWLRSNIHKISAIRLFLEHRNGSSHVQDILGLLHRATAATTLELNDPISLALPGHIAQLTGLQHLKISDCNKLAELPLGCTSFNRLQHLSLQNCLNLKHMWPGAHGERDCQPDAAPATTAVQLSSLQHLHVSRCRSLTELPRNLGISLGNELQQLHIDGCGMIKELPEGLGNLLHLKELKVGDCHDLQVLPPLGQLSSLRALSVYGCPLLRSLPSPLPTSLQKLFLSDLCSLSTLSLEAPLLELQCIALAACNRLHPLPYALGDLQSLTQLAIYGHSQLDSLPDSFSGLISLQQLTLWGCRRLKHVNDSIGQLPNLQQLQVIACTSLETLPARLGAGTPLLQKLHINGCGLRSLPDSIVHAGNLQQLSLLACPSLKCLPQNLGLLTDLQDLKLCDCRRLSALPDSLMKCSRLAQLMVDGCDAIKLLPANGWENLVKLEQMYIRECPSLVALPAGLAHVPNLDYCEVTNCRALVSRLNIPERVMELGCLQLH